MARTKLSRRRKSGAGRDVRYRQAAVWVLRPGKRYFALRRPGQCRLGANILLFGFLTGACNSRRLRTVAGVHKMQHPCDIVNENLLAKFAIA